MFVHSFFCLCLSGHEGVEVAYYMFSHVDRGLVFSEVLRFFSQVVHGFVLFLVFLCLICCVLSISWQVTRRSPLLCGL
jgi:hypothetical protein